MVGELEAGAELSCRSTSWNSVRKRSFASRLCRHQRSLASNRRWASSSRTTFTISSIPLQVLPHVHPSAGVGVFQCAIERGVQLGSFFGGELVVDHQNVDFRSVRQISGFIQKQPSVLHLDRDGQRYCVAELPTGYTSEGVGTTTFTFISEGMAVHLRLFVV